jgi:hypothetical protein
VGPIRTEWKRLMTYEQRHAKLLGRLGLVVVLTAIVDLFGTVAIYFAERHADRTEITTLGDAFFFTTVQLLTVSSQLRNPFTTMGRAIDIVLEIWAVVVVAGAAGAMADFFHSGSIQERVDALRHRQEPG